MVPNQSEEDISYILERATYKVASFARIFDVLGTRKSSLITN